MSEAKQQAIRDIIIAQVLSIGQCCYCLAPLSLAPSIGFRAVKRVARWADPTWVWDEQAGEPAERGAIAILCPSCQAAATEPKLVVEFLYESGQTKLRYHWAENLSEYKQPSQLIVTPTGEQYKDGYVWNGYDYRLQVWVVNGIIQDCEHPQEMKQQDCCQQHRLAGRWISEFPKEVA